MSLCSLFSKPVKDDPHRERREHILSAAERCFVRAGFHRSTIQDVATEAHMSAGNVYRYFPSKDAIVAGLVARDRAEVARDFEQLSPGDMMGSFAALMRRQIVESGRDKAALWLEICTEAARNPTIAALTRAYETEIHGRLTEFFRGVIEERPGRDTSGVPASPQVLAGLVISFLSGLMVRQAMSPGCDDAEQRVNTLLGIVQAGIEGRIALAADPAEPVLNAEPCR